MIEAPLLTQYVYIRAIYTFDPKYYNRPYSQRIRIYRKLTREDILFVLEWELANNI